MYSFRKKKLGYVVYSCRKDVELSGIPASFAEKCTVEKNVLTAHLAEKWGRRVEDTDP
jgi:hypothetical protein